jgi:hypothetical protein
LNSNTLSAKRSPKRAGLNSDISQTHGVEFFRGMLEARSNEPGSAASMNMNDMKLDEIASIA